jgi:hypothetical protein
MGKDEARQARIHDRLFVAVMALTRIGNPKMVDPDLTVEKAQAIAADALKLIMED